MSRSPRLEESPGGMVEEGGEGVPRGGHSDGNGEGSHGEGDRRGPQGGAVEAMERDQIIGDEQEDAEAEAGDGTGGGGESHAAPGEAAEGGIAKGDGGEEDEAFVRVGAATVTPCSEYYDGKPCDPEERDSERDGGIEGADLNPAMQGVEGGDDADDDHDRRQAESHGPEGAMPGHASGGNERGLGEVDQHPESEDGAVDMEDRAGQRGAQHAGTEVGGRKTDKYDDAEQDRHAAEEGAFNGAIHGTIDRAASARRGGDNGSS